MPGSSPLLGVSYPLSSDAPAGHSQMEVILRALEKYAVIPVTNAADRDSTITGALLHDGSVAYLESEDELQVYLGGAWKILLAANEKNLDLVASSLGTASGEKGRVRYRDSDDTLWFSDGSDWNRLVDATETRAARGNFSGDTVTTSSTGGTEDPGGGSALYVDYTQPETQKVIISISTQFRIDNSVGYALAGWQIKRTPADGGAVKSAFGEQRACRTDKEEHNGQTWQSVVTVGDVAAGNTLRVHFIHAVNSGARTATYNSREVTAQPVK